MSYNPALYQPNATNPYAGIGNNYSLYNNPGMSNMTGMNQPVYPQFTTPPLMLSAAYTKGEIGASSYPVANGNTVVLLDSDTIDTDNPIIYIKTTGYDGKPQTIKKINGVVSYPNEQGLFSTPVTTEVIKEVEKADINLDNYVTKNELNDIKENVDLITVQLEDYEKSLSQINEVVSNIDNRFNNMFNMFNNSAAQSSDNNQVNQINQNNKKNKNIYKKDGD